MKDLLGICIGIILTTLIVVIISKAFHKDTKEEKNSMLLCIDNVIPTMANINEEYRNVAKEDDPEENQNILQVMLKTEISSIDEIEKIEKEEAKNNVKERAEEKTEKNEKVENEKEEGQQIQVVQEGLQTQVITNNPINENSNVQYGKVKIKNQTEYTLTDDILKPDITIENKNILLFHTHSCESYTASEKYQYTPTGTFRTTDLNFSVVRVGTEFENQLKQYNYNVIHNTDYHDYPAYNGSYTRSLTTVENILKTNPTDIIMDIHRDAIGSRSDYAPTVKIGDTDEAAQIMFVIRNKWRRTLPSKLESKFKICYKSARKSRRNVSGII